MPISSSSARRAEPAPRPLAEFHPAVRQWFERHFAAPTPAQVEAWPAIREGLSTLVAAPTGSGKTLTAFLAAIDALVVEGLAAGGELADATQVVYVSPLKALSNDIRINLEQPLAGIREELARLGLPDIDIRSAVRTGDTPQVERGAMRKRPPHILVTTPESLYILLGSESGRQMLAGVRSVIVDEIHALAGSKRGSHLALSLERLQALSPRPLLRIGLSATQKPIEKVARFLVGASGNPRDPACRIVDIGYTRPRDLGIEVPPVALEAVMSNDTWELVYDRLAHLAGEHRTTLVFVNTRRMAERVTRFLAERLGSRQVAAHHGSLAKELRLDAEQRLKAGQLKVLVATASLELGIDIGDVELVCQLSSPRSIAAFLQRVGRSGHSVGGTPKGRLFPTSRDDLVECAALLDSVRRGELDSLVLPRQPLDVLAQQIVAEVACQEWREDDLYRLVIRAEPYAGLERERFDEVLRMLAEGYHSRLGVRGAYLHRDALNGLLRGRRGARLTALTSGGTIPIPATTACCWSRRACWWGRSTRTSRWRAWPATCSNWATPRTGSSASSRDGYGSRTPRASRRTFRSGWVRRRGAATSCRPAWRACATPSTSCSAKARHCRKGSGWSQPSPGSAPPSGWTMAPRGRSSSTWPAPARPWVACPGAGGW